MELVRDNRPKRKYHEKTGAFLKNCVITWNYYLDYAFNPYKSYLASVVFIIATHPSIAADDLLINMKHPEQFIPQEFDVEPRGKFETSEQHAERLAEAKINNAQRFVTYVLANSNYDADQQKYIFKLPCFDNKLIADLVRNTSFVPRSGTNAYGAEWSWEEEQGAVYRAEAACLKQEYELHVPIEKAKVMDAHISPKFVFAIAPQTPRSRLVRNQPEFGETVSLNIITFDFKAETIGFFIIDTRDSSILKSYSIDTRDSSILKSDSVASLSCSDFPQYGQVIDSVSTPALRNSVYRDLVKIQKLAESNKLTEAKSLANKLLDDHAAAKANPENKRTRRDFLNSYELSNVYNILAYVQYSKDNFKESRDAYIKILKQPYNPATMYRNTHFTVVQLYMVAEDWKCGVLALEDWLTRYAKDARQVSSDDLATKYALLAQGYWKSGMASEALKHVTNAIKIKESENKPVETEWVNLKQHLTEVVQL